MKSGSTSVRQHKFRTLPFLLLAASALQADPRCVGCHAKEDAAYSKTGMAKSLLPVSAAVLPPDGGFDHAFSSTQFAVHSKDLHSSSQSMMQTLARKDESAEQKQAFVIGSGEHAFGFLSVVGDHVFQSPISYYTTKKLWDVAPGYESTHFPDFSRPVTAECVFCHAGKPLPVADTLNRYQQGVFAATGITCERCHGDVSAHLASPTPGSILNPAKLFGAARASVCEQCHLLGETRIPNPSKAIVDFKPGQALEDFYTTYVAAQSESKTIKVVSQSEQLALSKCARSSGEKLWCGTCHNPHDSPVQPVAYYREKCMGCHAATLDKAHAAPDRDCIGCHMPQLPAKDGGHTSFVDHRIARNPGNEPVVVLADSIVAWREPDPYVRERNFALGLIATGLQYSSSADVLRGFKTINHLGAKQFANDPDLYTVLGLVLLKGKQADEALRCFRKAVAMKPNYAPYYINAASAMLDLNQKGDAIRMLETARTLDPLLQQSIQLLHQLYAEQGQKEKSDAVLAEYDKAMGSSHH